MLCCYCGKLACCYFAKLQGDNCKRREICTQLLLWKNILIQFILCCCCEKLTSSLNVVSIVHFDEDTNGCLNVGGLKFDEIQCCSFEKKSNLHQNDVLN